MQVGGEGLRTVWIYYKTVTKKKKNRIRTVS